MSIAFEATNDGVDSGGMRSPNSFLLSLKSNATASPVIFVFGSPMLSKLGNK